MYFKFTFLFLFLEFALVFCKNAENITSVPENYTSSGISTRKTRDTYNFVYADLIGCAVQSDPSCLVNVAENFLAVKKNELLAQADQEVMRATGRADPDNSPSTLSKTVEKLISDLTGLFKNGISRFFRDSDDDEDDLSEDQNSTDEDHNENKNRDIGEERGKKKKKKKKAALKKLAIFAIILAKLCLLLKLLQTGLLLKLALLGIGILGVSVAKLVIAIKQGHKKTIYYENSHHDHHYDHEDAWEHEHEHWKRSFNGQALAYSSYANKN